MKYLEAVEVVKKATTIKLFGEKLSDKAPITLDTVLKAPESFAGQSVIVTGVVRKVCQKKGCKIFKLHFIPNTSK